MRRSHLLGWSIAALLLAAMVGVAAASSRNFRAHLSGGEEVNTPENFHTLAQGQATFQLNEEGSELHYTLIVANIENPFMAHIHLAPAGMNGPIVAWLFPEGGPPALDTAIGRTDGVIAEGVITAADLVGPLAGASLSDLLAAIDAGNTYVNVHTNDFVGDPNSGPGDFQGGEIRGQIH